MLRLTRQAAVIYTRSKKGWTLSATETLHDGLHGRKPINFKQPKRPGNDIDKKIRRLSQIEAKPCGHLELTVCRAIEYRDNNVDEAKQLMDREPTLNRWSESPEELVQYEAIYKVLRRYNTDGGEALAWEHWKLIDALNPELGIVPLVSLLELIFFLVPNVGTPKP